MTDETEMEECNSMKFLGIHLDKESTWNYHLECLCKHYLNPSCFNESSKILPKSDNDDGLLWHNISGYLLRSGLMERRFKSKFHQFSDFKK